MSEKDHGVVTLVPVAETTVLEELMQAATAGAAADEVTPPLTPDGSWTPARIAWLRQFHHDRGAGLTGPAREATWAAVVDGSVVGSVRLKRTADDGVLETGAWLTRAARGHGVGRAALVAVLNEATAARAVAVRAETTTGNAAALAVLRRLGFECSPDPDGRNVRALLVLDRENPAAQDR